VRSSSRSWAATSTRGIIIIIRCDIPKSQPGCYIIISWWAMTARDRSYIWAGSARCKMYPSKTKDWPLEQPWTVCGRSVAAAAAGRRRHVTGRGQCAVGRWRRTESRWWRAAGRVRHEVGQRQHTCRACGRSVAVRGRSGAVDGRSEAVCCRSGAARCGLQTACARSGAACGRLGAACSRSGAVSACKEVHGARLSLDEMGERYMARYLWSLMDMW
jgi:hypothetical protein